MSSAMDAGNAGPRVDGGRVAVDPVAEAAVAGDAASDVEAEAAAQPPPQHPCYGHAGETVCEASVMHACSAEQVAIVRSTTCESNLQCQLGLAQGACAPCRPGHFRCEGMTLQRCSLDGSHWELIEECASTVLCNVSAGACTTQACVASTRKCEGPELLRCRDDFTALTSLATCASQELCDQAGGQCDICLANSRRCDGDIVVACSADGQSEQRTPCGGATPHCGAGGICVECLAPADCAATCRDTSCNALSGRCERTLVSAGSPCAAGVCDATGQCVSCVQDAHCPATLPRCSAGACLECLGNGDCDAVAHKICQGGTCVVGPYCGDGIVQIGESCDGNCPSSCRPSNPADCELNSLVGTASACTARCVERTITGCIPK
jgi:hypothetical protein